MPIGARRMLVIEGQDDPLVRGECELVHLRGSWVEKAVHDGSLEEAMLTAT